MKRLLAFALPALFLVGCNGVTMSPTYSSWVDRCAAQAADDAARAKSGALTEQQKTDALVGESQAWQIMRDARDGKATTALPQ